MIAAPLVALALVAASSAAPAPTEIDHAIAMGRFDEARIMIGRASKTGLAGDSLDRSSAYLAFATREDADAMSRYGLLLKVHPNDPQLLERAGIAAMRIGELALARDYLGRATSQAGATWRVWNATGVLADRLRDWSGADRAYARAGALSPNRAEVFNNAGWSQLLRGDWTEAVALLGRAAKLDPGSVRIADNLEFARMGVTADLPGRRAGEAASDWAARLNDAGVAAAMRGDSARAVAAFARAISTSETWNALAFANLEKVQHNQ